MEKSSVAEIRARFDGDVERFSNRETGQTATMDAALALNLLAETAALVTPGARSVLDAGCGAGNGTLALLERLPHLDATLCDLSENMLARAKARVGAATTGSVRTIQADIRALPLPPEAFDLIYAAAVLHHLRTPAEWESVFAKFFSALRPGGGLWIFDLVAHESAAVQAVQWKRYGAYLTELKDDAYRDRVFAYIEKEDTPATLTYQLELLRKTGFARIDVLHKSGPFAAFGAVK